MSDVVYLGRFKHDMLLETAKIFVVIEMTAVFLWCGSCFMPTGSGLLTIFGATSA